jgi:hypothetical protein
MWFFLPSACGVACQHIPEVFIHPGSAGEDSCILPAAFIVLSFCLHACKIMQDLKNSQCASFLLTLRASRPLKNYLRCRCGVKNRLKMLIYYA